jgi:flagellar hook-length control protein FliK
VDQLVQKLELVQLLNLVQSNPREKIFVLLPVWFENKPQFLELNISLPRQGSKGREEESLSVLFLLHLPHLGRMNIEVKMKGTRLYCQFRVTDPEVEKFMDPFLSDLKTRLSSLGFQSHLQLSTEPLTHVSSSLVSEVGEELKSLLSIVV